MSATARSRLVFTGTTAAALPIVSLHAGLGVITATRFRIFSRATGSHLFGIGIFPHVPHAGLACFRISRGHFVAARAFGFRVGSGIRLRSTWCRSLSPASEGENEHQKERIGFHIEPHKSKRLR
jgi:hypothetical protein